MLTENEEKALSNIRAMVKDGEVYGLIRLLESYKAMCVPQNPHQELIRNGTFIVVKELIKRGVNIKNI